MKRNHLIVCLMACLLISGHQINAQATVAGVTVPATMKAGNATLMLNGAGTRVKLFMDVYVGALYLAAKAQNGNGDAISKSNETMAVKIHITSGLVTSDRMRDAIKEGFEKSMNGNMAPLQAKIDKFVKVFSLEPIVKGNEFDIVYTPGTGTQIYKGGKLLETIDGLDFKSALWAIWIGNDPVEKSLKAAMLGATK